MKSARLLLLWVAFALANGTALRAQVPQLINFQGRVAADGVNFNGTAQFKFALVNGEGTATFWSNDGTGDGGTEPVAAVPIPVSQGLYSVLLGDATLTNMLPISAAIFTNGDVRLRIWFNDGTNGFEQLTPDQRIAAVGYAMMAANVQDGIITSAKLADRSVTGPKLAPNAVAESLRADGQSGVPSGGIVLSEEANSVALANAGYVRIGQASLDTDEWHGLPRSPVARSGHTAIWTGSEMIVWGGQVSQAVALSGRVNTGARYNPATDSWARTSTVGAPLARSGHSAVWTGREMIVWGGRGVSLENSGGRYDPVTDAWRATSLSGAPEPRSGHTAVWTGRYMIVWGGTGFQTKLNSGARYNPSADAWLVVSVNAAPLPRSDHTAIWTGSEMLIWGGVTTNANLEVAVLNSGGRYNPSSNIWTRIQTNNAPEPRLNHTGVWTGSELVVWGGRRFDSNNATVYPSNFGRYAPATDSWITRTNANTASARFAHTAVWTGTAMIAWGGRSESGSVLLNSGAIYDPRREVWSATPLPGAPAPAVDHTAVWTGTEMIVWGGLGKVDRLNSGGRYLPTSNRWVNLNVQTNALIQGRRDHTAIWTGTEMIVWGGTLAASREGPPVNTGFQYNPTTDLLVATPIPGAPAPRLRHTAVWTGTEMIIWGGASSSTGIPVNTGARYDPALKRWSPLPAPEITASARDSHTAVWTGNEMIIWGGRNPRPLDTGARFILASNTWVGMPTSGAPDPRFGHSAIWTGKEMIVWGGAYAIDGRTNLDSGGRFSPKQNSWVTTTPLEGAPSPRRGHTAIWTGKEMIVWGGLTNALESIPAPALWTGARFDPLANCWFATVTNGAPHFTLSERNFVGLVPSYHSAVWTGNEMIVFGEVGSGRDIVAAGARYNPLTDQWLDLVSTRGPSPRIRHTAVWTGTGMLVYGGIADDASFDPAIYYYTRAKPVYLYKKP